ncbi:biopolymer transport protein ExbB [Sinorhizobium glycinis]|uniref:Biopolymer transport protein ExbB n=1 Tax=Sinorhizobium glycinis TaxID=1472378 RepID=A0A178XIE7_9HYPH|nr:tonB-system energizer ExbB [Sinorhizobium glycinis]OAP34502.1 biopolymer transport protein ExbB [Sinorhizobium glycinis]
MSNWTQPTLNMLMAATLAIFLAGPEVAVAQTAPTAPIGEQTSVPMPAAAENNPALVTTPPPTDGSALAGGGAAVLPHDLSPVGMFLAADVVVKSVMIALALASVLTWAIFFVKTLELAFAKSRIKRAVRVLTAAKGLSEVETELDRRAGAAAEMIAAAIDELSRSEVLLDQAPAAGVKERVASLLARIEIRAGKRMSAGTGVLASIGSVGPFVGLFGTVWGIMNSFIGISKAQTTNLAIVAPGIAEALLATAIGLVAAIPAVVIYNYFARSVGGYKLILADAADAVERLVSRDLDYRHVRKAQPRRQDGYGHGADASIARIG